MFKRDAATKIAHRVVDVLRPDSDMITLAGSIRRGKTLVKDAEIVVMPKPDMLTQMLAKLDGMIARGEATQAVYAEKTRWGDRYRGLLVDGLKVEVFIPTPETWGYILWLRTGPGECNTLVMSHMKNKRWPVRFMDGAAWTVHYDHAGEAQKVGQLKVASEDDVFKLIGLQSLYPQERNETNYLLGLHKAVQPSAELVQALRVDAPKKPHQQSLF